MVLAWKLRGAVRPDDGSVNPVGPVMVDEVHGTTGAGCPGVGSVPLVLQ